LFKIITFNLLFLLVVVIKKKIQLFLRVK